MKKRNSGFIQSFGFMKKDQDASPKENKVMQPIKEIAVSGSQTTTNERIPEERIVIKPVKMDEIDTVISIMARGWLHDPRFEGVKAKSLEEKEKLIKEWFGFFVQNFLKTKDGHVRTLGLYVDNVLRGVFPFNTQGCNISIWRMIKLHFFSRLTAHMKPAKKWCKRSFKTFQTLVNEDLWLDWLLTIDPNFQGKGLGSLLLQHGLRQQESEHFYPSYSIVSTELAVQFLKKNGYEVIASLKNPTFWILTRKAGGGSSHHDSISEQYFIKELKNLNIMHIIGEGKYGQVFYGEWNGTPVALKKLLNASEREAFRREANLLFSLAHPNIVRLLGLHTEGQEEYMVVEYVNGGSVLSLLRQKKESLTLANLLHMTVGAARGLVYLENQKIVHRDISARNLLVDENFNVKVSDFGMSRLYQDFYLSSSSQIPIRWSAPEVLQQAPATSKADVAVWEILEFGASESIRVIEYHTDTSSAPHLGLTNMEVMRRVSNPKERNILEKPPNCPDELYDLMLRCWSYDPVQRPTFVQILKEIELIRRQYHMVSSSESSLDTFSHHSSSSNSSASLSSLSTSSSSSSASAYALSPRGIQSSFSWSSDTASAITEYDSSDSSDDEDDPNDNYNNIAP